MKPHSYIRDENRQPDNICNLQPFHQYIFSENCTIAKSLVRTQLSSFLEQYESFWLAQRAFCTNFLVLNFLME